MDLSINKIDTIMKGLEGNKGECLGVNLNLPRGRN